MRATKDHFERNPLMLDNFEIINIDVSSSSISHSEINVVCCVDMQC